MKKFLAFMMCTMMLCIGTIQAKESKVNEQLKIEQSCIDVGKVQQPQIVQIDQVFDIGQIVMYNHIIKQSDEQSDKYVFQKDALYSQYRFIPDCPVGFIGKIKIKYITHYAYNFSNPHNQPPSK